MSTSGQGKSTTSSHFIEVNSVGGASFSSEFPNLLSSFNVANVDKDNKEELRRVSDSVKELVVSVYTASTANESFLSTFK